MDDIIVKIDKNILGWLVEYLESKGSTETATYLEGLLWDSEKYNDIVEKADNFDFLDQYAIANTEPEEGESWWDIEDLPSLEIVKGWLGFQEYITLLRTQGDEKIVH